MKLSQKILGIAIKIKFFIKYFVTLSFFFML